MSVFDGSTLRVINSGTYRVMIQHGWAALTPYLVADVLCALHGKRVHNLGLSWEVTPRDATKPRDMEVGVPTIALLLALGYGTRRQAVIEWTLRRWPLDGKASTS